MRDIKFRVYRHFPKEEILYFTIDDLIYLKQPVQVIQEFQGVKDTLMQYTGLKDKKGKEIYEGDIVNDGDLNFEVYRHNSGEWKAGWCSLWEYISDNEIENCWEIVGNIYENPEILENNL
ncbi:YopX family protein [Clostridium sp. HBUAS56017]|uniref:YopX family protein n=1 Tax=Clostridium sp. HBUAS56017 TaxID=2571128 RepID=UPI00117792A6|nr:YopX family protein [Clostridium sp. HBUAS56017]